MAAGTPAVPSSNKMIWAGYIVSGLIVLMLLAGSIFGILKAAEMAPQMAKYGFPEGMSMKVNILCIICALIYAFPRTAVLGAILLTGYFGGAVITHLRVGEPFWIPILVSVLAWGGIFLRDEKLRALIPLRR